MSDYELTCLSSNEFPILEDNIEEEPTVIGSKEFLKLLNKTKFAISNDETRHYLNGIYLGCDQNDKSKLIAVATDGHRLCKTLIEVQDIKKFSFNHTSKKNYFRIIDDPWR